MNWLSRVFGVEGGRPVVAASRARARATRVIGPSPDLVIAAPARFAWDEKRWQHKRAGDRQEFTGQYRVFDRQGRTWREFHGYISHHGTEIAAYIADPPLEMRRHPHGACLQLTNAPWFRLHWNRHPSTVDDALIYMERMLDESFNQGRRG